jgi:hypothetical protein
MRNTTTPLRRAARFVALALSPLLAIASASAEDWPPADPGEIVAKVEFTPAWASGLRGIDSLQALQEAAGARGKIADVVLDGDSPHVVYDWTGAGKGGRMRAFLYKSGGFGAIITPAGNAREIVLNSFQAFVCDSCSPPVNACGHRPSWVPHDLHWDVFDCGCTLTGPQSLHAGPC